jgi:hypothetical protein
MENISEYIRTDFMGRLGTLWPETLDGWFMGKAKSLGFAKNLLKNYSC